MLVKTAIVTYTLAFLTLSVPAFCHGLEEREVPVHKESISKQVTARADSNPQKAEEEKGQSVIMPASSDPPKEKPHPHSFLMDQLEQKSPVYLWVPRGGVGVGFAMTW